MWRDDNIQIMDILDNIETEKKSFFPVICPICRRQEGHLYFHRNKESDEKGSMWTWCSDCFHSAHAMYRLPKWWRNLKEIDIKQLNNSPDYLEQNKVQIDAWVNKLVCDDSFDIK